LWSHTEAIMSGTLGDECSGQVGRLARHHLERAPRNGEVGPVDDEEVRAGDAGVAFARIRLFTRDVNDVDGEIGELGGAGRGVVGANFPRAA